MSKKYILIQNDGEIETNSFELIGASTKRGETGKIGFFGSGLKYSIAYMMRNNIDFKVYSGEHELKFSTIPETLKEQTFDRICINGKPTSYTVTMGPTWKDDWFVLREVYCNALDEGTCQLVKSTENVNPQSGKTRIFIQLTPVLEEVINNWNSYFADEREPLFTATNIYTCAVGVHEGETTQNVLVYSKTKGIIYRKGIRVFNNSEYLYDYGLKCVDINEDRTAKSHTSMSYAFTDMMGKFVDEAWVKSVLRTALDDHQSAEYFSISAYTEDNFSPRWVQFSKENLLVVKDISGRFSEEIRMSKREVFYIPSSFARAIKKHHPDSQVLGMGNITGNYASEEVAKSAKMDFLLKEVLQSLKEMSYEVSFDISVVEFEKDEILGAADIKNKKILLSKQLFDMGRREIAMTLIEETEHIRSGQDDMTRSFQTHLISQWLTTMENSNGLFL